MSGNQVTAPTRAEFRRIQDCKNLAEAFACPEFLDRIKQSAPAHVKPQRMLRTFIQATSRTPDLLKCSMRSVLGAMLTCSEVGLEPNTPLQHAFLIPFARTKWDPQARKRVDMGHEVQLIFGYPGLLDLAYRSGHVTSVHADVVWTAEAKDEKRFSFAYGTDAHLRHVPMGHHEDNEKPMWVYAHANLTNGQAFEVMPWSDVMRIRSQSQGFQAAQRAKEQGENAAKPYIPRSWTDAPWVKHELPMARKTAFRSLWKWLPHSVELAGALALDEQQDRGFVDFGSVLDGSASVMEGGFEEGEAIEVETKDPTATFTDRREPVIEKTPDATTTAKDQPSSVEHDSDGVIWDATRHASSKARNTDGTWRARRGVGSQEAAAPTQEPTDDGLPFDRWDAEKAATIPPAAILENGKVTPVETMAFSAWLLDHEGEGIGDDPIDDPVKWAHAYVAAKADLFPDDVEAFETNNHDAAREAMIASTEVFGILAPKRVMDSPKAVMGVEPVEIDPAFVSAPTKPTKTEYDSYMARLETKLAMEDTDEWFTRVEMANLAVYGAKPPTPGAFPEVRRLKCLGLVADRRAAIRSAPERDATDFNTLADGMLKDIASWETVEKLDQWRNYGPVLDEFTNLKQSDEALYHKVVQAADAKRVTLELFEELKARALACEIMDDATKLQADKDYLGKVAIMHKADPTLWPKLRSVAMEHIEAIKARGAT